MRKALLYGCVAAMFLYLASITVMGPVSGGGGTGTGTTLPGNAAGALTNNGAGTLGWLSLANLGGGSTQIYDITNGITDANVQAVMNSKTNLTVQPGHYNFSTAFVNTNGGYIQGNGAWFHWSNATALALTGPMLDFTTNLQKPVTIDGLNFDGGIVETYNSATYFDQSHLVNNGFYGVTVWSNRWGVRLECSGGALVRNCTFQYWSGQGLLVINDGGNQIRPGAGKAIVAHNQFFSNYVGVFMPNGSFETPGFNNNPSASWNPIEPDYSIVEDNTCQGNQNGIVADTLNCIYRNNVCAGNYVGIIQNSLPGQADVTGNNCNHNTIGIYDIGGTSQQPNYGDNILWADTWSFVGVNCSGLNFRHNLISAGITITNTSGGSSSGVVLNNTMFSAEAWNGGSIPINITNGIIIGGNIDQPGVLSDGSLLSTLIQSNAIPFNNALMPPGTNQFTPVNGTLYTNVTLHRMAVCGTTELNLSSGSANFVFVDIHYTNSGIGHKITQYLGGASVAETNYQEYYFPVEPGGTFEFNTSAIGGTVVFPNALEMWPVD